MDVNDLRSAVTVIGLVLFLALVVWTWRRSGKAAFDEAAQLPSLEDGPTGHPGHPASAPHPLER